MTLLKAIIMIMTGINCTYQIGIAVDSRPSHEIEAISRTLERSYWNLIEKTVPKVHRI